jgi:hypothetical protein
MNDAQRKQMDEQEDRQLRSSAQQVGMRVAADQKERTVHNENFLNELRRTDDVDGDDSALEDEFADWFAGVKAVTNRGDQWDQMADLIMMNKRERALAERRPGRLLRDRPFLRATMQGADSPQLDAYNQPGIPGSQQYWLNVISQRLESPAHNFTVASQPASSEEQSKIYGAAEVAADQMALSRNGAGLESVSTVKTETNVRRQEEEDTTAKRLGKVME